MNGQQPELRIEILLEEVIRKRASDLHNQVGLPPMLRIDGSLTPIPGHEGLVEEQIEQLVFAILDDDQKQILLKDKEFDFSFAFGDLGRFRVNAFHERGNLAAAIGPAIGPCHYEVGEEVARAVESGSSAGARWAADSSSARSQ
jgi:Tfp pilus assembly pilus retraction ATPase PilT